MFGDVWEWTASAYAPYPGFRAARRARSANTTASSCATRSCCAAARAPRRPSTSRATYRNFFRPHARWQFSGHPPRETTHDAARWPTVERLERRATRTGNASVADVLAGLGRAAEAALRRSTSTTSAARELFDADLRAAGVLPDAHRARDPARARARSAELGRPHACCWSSSAAAAARRRACCSTACATPRRLRAGRHLAATHLEARAERLARGLSAICRCCRSCADFTQPLRAAADARQPAARASCFFPGSTIGNFEPPRRAALLRGACASCAARRRAADRRRPAKDPRAARRLQRRARRHGGVQSQPAGAHQPRARRRLRPRRLPPRAFYDEREGPHRDAPREHASAAVHVAGEDLDFARASTSSPSTRTSIRSDGVPRTRAPSGLRGRTHVWSTTTGYSASTICTVQ